MERYTGPVLALTVECYRDGWHIATLQFVEGSERSISVLRHAPSLRKEEEGAIDRALRIAQGGPTEWDLLSEVLTSVFGIVEATRSETVRMGYQINDF